MKIFSYTILAILFIFIIGYCTITYQLKQTTWGGWTPDSELLDEDYIPTEQSKKENNSSPIENKRCEDSSEWRDHNGPDNCSYYSSEESCDKIRGKMAIITQLHKGFLEKDVFEGTISNRWFDIKGNSVIYYEPSGEIIDNGNCNCMDGILKIKWKNGKNVPAKAQIHFNSSDTVELRYYDFPMNFRKHSMDTTKSKTNPTKILGVMRYN